VAAALNSFSTAVGLGLGQGRPTTRSVVGIELGCVCFRQRATTLTLSVCEMGSQFRHGHVLRGPPIMPDGRISQVRFEALASRP